MASALVDVAGPRLHMRPVARLPLIHFETPRFDGRTVLLKRSFDVVASGLGLLCLSPLLLVTATIIKLSDGGPVFFLQERVGWRGQRFRMFKFRSMVVDAEARLAEVRAQVAREADASGGSAGRAGNEVLFKLKDDPCVTRIGRVLRKYSIDQLPQLINVLLGHMSLVGPRLPLPREVATYEKATERKFLVKPGVTGLWQVSGRSNLSWDSRACVWACIMSRIGHLSETCRFCSGR